MILSDREIAAAMERGSVLITPWPGPDAWSSTAVDFTLDGQISRWKAPPGAGFGVVAPGSPDFRYSAFAAANLEKIDISAAGFDLSPMQFVLGWTVEAIELPHRSRIAARVEGKSSLARLGLGVHVTAPIIHAGFGYDPTRTDETGNPIRLEIFNLGPYVIHLEKGMRICQLIFEEVHGTPQKGYAGMFAGQGPATR